VKYVFCRSSSLDLAGFQLATVLSVIVTGQLLERFGSSAARSVVLGTALVSLVPLVLWSLALPWIERQDRRDKESIQVQAERTTM
jgi:MFS family permease